MSTTFLLSKIFGIFPFGTNKLSIPLIIISACYQIFYLSVLLRVQIPNRDSALFDYANILRRLVIVAPTLLHLFRLAFIRRFFPSLKPIIVSHKDLFWFDFGIPAAFFAWKFFYYMTWSLRVRFRTPLVIVYYVITLMTHQYVLCIEVKMREIVKWKNKIESHPLTSCNQLHRISAEVENLHKLYSPQLLLAMFALLSNFVTNLYLLQIENNRDINIGSVVENICWLVSTVQRCTHFETQTYRHNGNSDTLTSLVKLIQIASQMTTKVDEFYKELFRVVWKKDLCSNKKLVLYLLIQRKVNFSACGFFTLGNTVLTSIFSAATTYLVILLQYDKEE